MKRSEILLCAAVILMICFAESVQAQKPRDFNPRRDPNSSRNSFNSFETDAIVQKFFTGASAGDSFGQSVSSAGDVNGDGYEDLIVGAPDNDAAGSNSGRAYIYFGGMVINTIADVILTGEAADDRFGISVSSAGDLNGDGYGDVIVGASENDAGGVNAGRAYIYLGGAVMNNTADVVLNGVAADNLFGFSVSEAGDVNGDGFGDVIVGAYQNSSAGAAAGRAYIYFGGALPNNTADVTLTGLAAGDNFGYSVSSAGDVNGDGFGDVIVGARGNDAAGVEAGAAYVYFGGGSMNSVADMTLAGAAANDSFGYSVSGAGDIDGDGFSDVIAGAYGNDAGGSGAGRAYIYRGGIITDNIADVILTGADPGDNFGAAVSSAGDVNGDGYGDVIVGATGSDAVGSLCGRAYIFYGGSSMDIIADALFTGAAAGDLFGISVSSAGDVNGDGYSDIIAGAYSNDAAGVNAGRAYLYTNSAAGNDIADEIFGGSTNDLMGYSVSSAGDVNGDGYDDVIAGAYGNNSERGAAYIYYGGPLLDNTADVTILGAAAGDHFGACVSGVGDVNGDGYDDVAVGAPDNDFLASNGGRAYIYFGGSNMNNTVDVTINGAVVNGKMGTSVSSAGDVNGDGYSDVIVGEPYSNYAGNQSGRAYILYGGSPMNSSADVVITGNALSEFVGYSVSSLGDVNNDGYDDVIAGAPGYTSTGAAYVYYGGQNMNSAKDMILKGRGNSDFFGSAVSGNGDLNGDGFPDIAVGDYNGNGINFQSGLLSVYWGGTVIDTTADLTLSGNFSYDYLGYDIDISGDVNNDGFSDIVVSAPGYLNQAGYGLVLTYFGGANMDDVPDVSSYGSMNDENLGFSVDCSGDINADGMNDIITGAPWNSEGGASSGRAMVYISSSPKIQPGIISVRDVPFDQGGFVSLKWMRSGFDAAVQNSVTGYLIEKSLPPGISGFSWQNVATVPATRNPSYTFNAPTQSDSMTNNTGTNFFRVTALTSDPNMFWRSNIMPGYSVDNLSPAQPSGLMASLNGSSVDLNWNDNTESDFHHYAVFRNGIQLQTAPASSFTDANAVGDSVFSYSVSAVDIHGNYSPQSDAVNVQLYSSSSITVTAVIQGFYNPSSNLMLIPDTATVFVRSSVFPYAVVDSSRAVISPATLSATFYGIFVPPGNYYLAIRHRNSVETWSSVPVSINGGNAQYNFTASASQAFGNNIVQVDASPVRFALFSGDVNQDGAVDATDLALIDNDAFGFLGGYLPTDLTGDSFIDGTDFAVADNNASNFVSVVRP